jgi:transcriptional regulator with XRE-family HTH domain
MQTFWKMPHAIEPPIEKKPLENLRKLREKKEYSQRMLADLANINFTQIGKIERGQINTSLSTIYTIAKALEIAPAKLLTFDFKQK